MTLPIIILKTDVLFPSTVASIFIKQTESIKAIETIASSNSQDIIVTYQKNLTVKKVEFKDIYTIGVKMQISQIITMPENNVKILGNVIEKVRILSLDKKNDTYIADYEIIENKKPEVSEVLTEKIYRTLYMFSEYMKLTKHMANEELETIKPNNNPILFSYILANKLDVSIKNKQKLLESSDPHKNLDIIQEIVSQKTAMFETETKIHNKLKEKMTKAQKEMYLNEKIKIIYKELGINDTFNEINEMEKKAKKLKMSPEAMKKFKSEIEKIKKNHHLSHEIGISRAYLENLLALPWSKVDKEHPNLDQIKKQLDDDHYGLEKVKTTIIEHMSTLQRVESQTGQIICLVGPPGVGKTSLAESIAKAIKREFARFSLGGVYSETEMRGHRKTYIGAMPGRIIRMLQKTKTNNPVILLDEIDKVGFKNTGNNQSDITSALLEVLDKSQNKHFIDHYIEVEYDLSQVTFIATANSYDIQEALLDRMHIIDLSGYTDTEKINIALKHLIHKQKKECGLKDNEIEFTENAIRHIIHYYTREAGIRSLDRLIQKICQKVLVKILNKELSSEKLTEDKIKDYLGEKKFLHTKKNDDDSVGVVNGLAYTSVGGDMLQIEAVKIPGEGKIILTGKLGKVMEESAQIAYSCFKSKHLNIEYNKFDMHIHVPSGAVPKDGPSAGITLYTSIYSLLLNKKVNNNVAMTGEINLQGKVMPIGGLKEKMLGAIRADIKTVIVPFENKKDLEDIPEDIKNKLEIVLVKRIDEVINVAIQKD